MIKNLFIGLLAFAAALSPMQTANAVSSDYVRTANYFLMSGLTLDDEETRETLMKYDLLVLPPEAELYNKDFFEEAREVNPDIIILAYVPTVSWNNIWKASIYTTLKDGIQHSWWLEDENGNQISIWPNTEALNLTTGWSDYLADWVEEEVLDTGYWDGVFYDEVSAEIAWVGEVDLDGNGVAESDTAANAAWTDGLQHLFDVTRARMDSDEIIVMNGSSNLELMSDVNGRMFESFPTPWEGTGSWREITERYLDLEDAVGHDPVFIINGNSDNTGISTDYRKVRFGLTSTLLGNGFFGFDHGTLSHNQTWYYDEYDVYLGEPVEDPQDLLHPTSTTFQDSVWGRDFEQGKSLVNSTGSTQTVRLDGEYEKLHGTQDTGTNDGRIVSSVTLPPLDGLILLRPLEEIFGSTYKNGAFVRIFNGEGEVKRTGFFAYDEDAKGGEQVVRYDLDHDGTLELIAAGESRVDIYEEDGTPFAHFYPYTENYKLGVNISVGDLESDGTVEIVTGTENGGGPQMRIFNGNGTLIHPGFFAYDTAFRGGVNISIGDLNGDGWKEIIAGAGVGGGPHVRVFNKDGKVINPGFFAFDPAFRGGVNVAVGDVDGNGVDEIIAAPGKGGGPEVRIYNQDGALLQSGFFAYDEGDRNGLEVSAGDLDEDGVDEIIAIGSDVFTLSAF